MKLKDYDFEIASKFPISFSKEEALKTLYVDVFGILRFGELNNYIILYEMSEWGQDLFKGFEIKSMRLSNFVGMFADYKLVEKAKFKKKVEIGTRKITKQDYIILKRFVVDDHNFIEVKKLHQSALEKTCNITNYFLELEFEDFREEEVEEELLNDGIE